MAQLVYTFYINDPDPDAGIFGCVADSEEEAEKLARKMGYIDFFLANTRELEPHESESFIDRSIKRNPFVGEQWLGVIEAIEVLVDERTFSRSNPTWTIQTYGKKYGLSPDTSPYVQAILEADGSLHVELSGNSICVPPLTDSQVEQLEWVGWTAPSEDEPQLPNFFRSFEPGWHPRYVAERIVESLTSIMGITEDDYFNFAEDPATISKISTIRLLNRLPINPRSNPNGSIFAVGAAEEDELGLSLSDALKVEFDDGLPGRTESVAVRFWPALQTLPASVRFGFRRESDTVMRLERKDVTLLAEAFPWGARGEAVNLYALAAMEIEQIEEFERCVADGLYDDEIDFDPVIGQWTITSSGSIYFNVRLPLKALDSGNVFMDLVDYIDETVRSARPVLVQRFAGKTPESKIQ